MPSKRETETVVAAAVVVADVDAAADVVHPSF